MIDAGVAVVITVRSRERDWPAAIESVLDQTLVPAEVVIVDDGSLDGATRQAVSGLGALDVRVVADPGGGSARAWNAGVRATRSAAIVLLDTADTLGRTYLAETHEVLASNPDLSFVSTAVVSARVSEDVWTPPEPDLVRSLTHGAVHVSSMVRRSAWNDAGGFDETLDGYEDLDFWVTLLARGHRGCVIPRPLFHRGSRTAGPMSRERHVDLMRRIYAKHREALEPRFRELLMEKEQVILGERRRQRVLVEQRDARRAEGAGVAPARATAPDAILMYHRIGGRVGARDLSISTDAFEAHAAAIVDAGLRVVPLSELIDPSTDAPGQGRIAITFDDGYAELLEGALQTLIDRQWPATVFVVAAAMEDGYEFWWDTLHRLLLSDRTPPPTLTIPDLPDLGCGNTRTWPERLGSHDAIAERLVRLPRRRRDGIIEALRARCGDESREGPRPMTGEEVRRVARMPGIEIGAHSRHHVWLPAERDETVRDEIAVVRRELQALTGQNISAFAYPYGGHDRAVRHVARDAGFTLAVTAAPDLLTGSTDAFALPRIDASRWGAAALPYRLRQLGVGRQA